MVILRGLFMEVVSIVLQSPLKQLYLVVRDGFQFRTLNFTQKFLNANEKILWPGELLSCLCEFMCRKGQKSEDAKSGM
jgi:hypothetical protein